MESHFLLYKIEELKEISVRSCHILKFSDPMKKQTAPMKTKRDTVEGLPEHRAPLGREDGKVATWKSDWAPNS